MLHVTNKDDCGLQGAGLVWQMSEGALVQQTNKERQRSVDYVDT